MREADAARSLHVGDRFDPQDYVVQALAERRGQPLERAAGDRIDVDVRGQSAREALGGSHAEGTRDRRYTRQPCPKRKRPLDEPPSSDMRSGGRVVEGARLESEYTAKPYRGFESLPLRQRCSIAVRTSPPLSTFSSWLPTLR